MHCSITYGLHVHRKIIKNKCSAENGFKKETIKKAYMHEISTSTIITIGLLVKTSFN
jgi:hypothetical protein